MNKETKDLIKTIAVMVGIGLAVERYCWSCVTTRTIEDVVVTNKCKAESEWDPDLGPYGGNILINFDKHPEWLEENAFMFADPDFVIDLKEGDRLEYITYKHKLFYNDVLCSYKKKE